MNTLTLIFTAIVWSTQIAITVAIYKYMRRRLALSLLVDVWYMLEEMRTNTEMDILWVNQFNTAYDGLLDIADRADPAIGITLMQYIEFSQQLHKGENINDQA